MAIPDLVTMSMRELDRMKVIQAVADGHLARWRAAERLGISARHVRRLVLRLQEDGPSGLVSRKRGRPSNRQLPPGLESRIHGLIRDSYADFGPTLAWEKLCEWHGIEISKACVRRIMIDAGFWVPRRQRPPKVHQPRNRPACLGELVQIDGSDHRQFEASRRQKNFRAAVGLNGRSNQAVEPTSRDVAFPLHSIVTPLLQLHPVKDEKKYGDGL